VCTWSRSWSWVCCVGARGAVQVRMRRESHDVKKYRTVYPSNYLTPSRQAQMSKPPKPPHNQTYYAKRSHQHANYMGHAMHVVNVLSLPRQILQGSFPTPLRPLTRQGTSEFQPFVLTTGYISGGCVGPIRCEFAFSAAVKGTRGNGEDDRGADASEKSCVFCTAESL
jgi:hypothetical protein